MLVNVSYNKLIVSTFIIMNKYQYNYFGLPALFFLMASMAVANYCSAQVEILFSQDFENGLGSMISIDNDGLIVADALAESLNIPTSPSQWSAVRLSESNITAAVSPSWFNPVGVADDWLITPLIDIRAGTVIEWSAFSLNPSFRDGYQVLVSTSGPDLTGFTPILEVTSESENPTFRILDLSMYEDQSIHLAFRNNSNNKQALALDDVVIRTSLPIDARINKVTLSQTTFLEAGFNTDAGLPGSKQVLVDFVNVGRDIISDVSFNIEAMGTTYMESHQVELLPGQTFTVVSEAILEYGVGENQSYTISDIMVNDHSISAPIEATVSIFPSVPNYDVVGSKGELVNVHELLAQNKTIVLDFFASWCAPCQITTPILNDWYEQNGSGAGDLEVIGIDIEPNDDNDVVNSLEWGATYPKVAFTPDNELYRLHFNDIHGLNTGQLPYFVMICPSPDNVADSEVLAVQIGIPQPPTFDFWQPDLESCIEGITSTENPNENNQVVLYPNPSSGIVALDLTDDQEGPVGISIMSVDGEEIESKQVDTTSTIRLDLGHLDPGLYLIRISSRDRYEIKKIIIH